MSEANEKVDGLVSLILQALDERDSYSAIEMLAKHDPQLAADAYSKVQLELYWKRKDVAKMIAISRAGIQHGLTAAQQANTEAAYALRSAVKGLAYNLASFTWPGWHEPGIVLTSSDIAIGMDAAKLNLRLAEELNKPEKGKANAYWVLGAHHLVLGDHSLANETFLIGKSHAAAANDVAIEGMLNGYIKLSTALQSPNDSTAEADFTAAVESLKQLNDKDAKFYADQLLADSAYFRRNNTR